MEQQQLQELFRKYYNNEISQEERSLLMEYLSHAAPEALGDLITAEGLQLDDIHPVTSPVKAQEMLAIILQSASPAAARRGWWKYATAAAAAAAILTGIVVTTLTFKRSSHPPERVATLQTNIQPANEKATLILGNNTTVTLDTDASATLPQQGNTQVRLQQGQLHYESNGNAQQLVYNTLKTGRGNHFTIRLSDGTQVWLNSATSLEFPATFGKTERSVNISGEAYFQVVPDATRPFRVHITNKGTIEVLGTAFNIAAYKDDDKSATTLIDGAVKVSSGHSQQVLSPGQQAVISHQPDILLNTHPDLSQVLAWRNGYFKFDNTSVSSLMKEISRWYDVDIVYKGQPSEDGFTGTISRNVPLEKVLKVLDLNGVHCSINGKVITVTQ
ncbi:FecR family protein [Chitinophaga sp. Cy-1792]|uniref:FecR family protein n=1 Tax=Chitinophaga sp. Cy-1792 TaxID=2608339 RepID=UPI00142493B4|nr:FecR family protein [Chitinophaga sp. Cy-1792]NIG56776.1 DUF4974 domain-containing protein [Chitinophaga sp. Cy-1792]